MVTVLQLPLYQLAWRSIRVAARILRLVLHHAVNDFDEPSHDAF
ncbi:hypothetical protein PJ311_16165 [Bacillus sp. CLL-7-23]|uniref:Uncharacterized protein n=1 Tax=Bacillus changyiensis TaxID=3004103 RepID=A0ABT4X743_9BACI|nr:hypothetical protein [Bacillus changyiensis]